MYCTIHFLKAETECSIRRNSWPRLPTKPAIRPIKQPFCSCTEIEGAREGSGPDTSCLVPKELAPIPRQSRSAACAFPSQKASARDAMYPRLPESQGLLAQVSLHRRPLAREREHDGEKGNETRERVGCAPVEAGDPGRHFRQLLGGEGLRREGEQGKARILTIEPVPGHRESLP